MTTLIIPTSKETPDYTQRTSLDGRDYIFRFVWSGREQKWYVSLADADGVSIAAGLKVVASWDLLRKVQDPRRPPGLLLALDMSDSAHATDPSFAELAPGERVRLTYLDAAQVALLAGV